MPTILLGEGPWQVHAKNTAGAYENIRPRYDRKYGFKPGIVT